MEKIIKLNIGTQKPLKGYINYDKYPQHPDIKHLDIAITPINLPSNHADEILLDNTLEHIHGCKIDIINELYRILKPQGKLIIRLPTWQCGAEHETFYHSKRYFNGITRGTYTKFQLKTVKPYKYRKKRNMITRLRELIETFHYKGYEYILIKPGTCHICKGTKYQIKNQNIICSWCNGTGFEPNNKK